MATDIRKLTADEFDAKCYSLQHLALIRLASQSDWCDPLEIEIPPNVFGPLRVKGLVDMLPRNRFHPPRYRINAAGMALLSEKVDAEGLTAHRAMTIVTSRHRRKRPAKPAQAAVIKVPPSPKAGDPPNTARPEQARPGSR